MAQAVLNPNIFPYHASLAVAPAPPNMFLLPLVGTYGVSYDIFTAAIERPLPLGWDQQRSSLYRRIGVYLTSKGFARSQYSVWQKQDTPFNVWVETLGMRDIEPRGIFSTTLRRLQIFAVPLVPTFILDHDVAIRGVYSPTPIGPSPRALINNIGLNVPHVNGFAAVLGRPPPQGWPTAATLPKSVHRVPTSLDPNNWALPQ